MSCRSNTSATCLSLVIGFRCLVDFALEPELTEGEVTVRLIKVGAGGGGGRIAGRDQGRREGAAGLEGLEDGCGIYSLCCNVICSIVPTTFSHID